MASQIEKLRSHFNGLNTTQKKAFIDNLKQKLQDNTNAEYTEFLNECVKKHKMEISGSSFAKRDFDDLRAGDLSVAEPSERLIAYLLDLIPMIAIGILLGIVFGILFGLRASNEINELSDIIGRSRIYSYQQSIIERNITYGVYLAIPLTSIVYCIFQFRYWKNSTSWGKKKMKLIVVNKDKGNKLSFGYMFLRELFGKSISGMVFSLGFIWILLDKDKQAWHDKLVSSVVVKK